MIKVKDAYNKYALIDQGSELRYVPAAARVCVAPAPAERGHLMCARESRWPNRGADVTLKLSWDVMPVTGSLNLQQQGVYKFKLPSEYV